MTICVYIYIYICYICADGADNIICWQYVLTRVVSSPPYQPLADHTSSLTPPKKVISTRYQAFFHPEVYSPRVSISIAHKTEGLGYSKQHVEYSMPSTRNPDDFLTMWWIEPINHLTNPTTLAFKSFTERFVVRRELPFRFRPWFRKACYRAFIPASLRSPVKLERLDESLFKTFLVPHDMKSKLAQLGLSIHRIHRIHKGQSHECHESHSNEPWGHEDLGK